MFEVMCLAVAMVIGGIVVILFSKNNKHHIEEARKTIIDEFNKMRNN